MLEKKTIDINTEKQMQETLYVQDINGNTVAILKRIPFAEKEEFVRELAEMTLTVHEDVGICYVSALYDVICMYLFAKYYTDIDVSAFNSAEDYYRLYDYCLLSNINWHCSAANEEDNETLQNYWQAYSQAVIRLYEKDNSLERMAKEWLNGDPAAENAETRALVEKLIDMKQSYLDQGEKPTQNVGGGILNFAKKKRSN